MTLNKLCGAFILAASAISLQVQAASVWKVSNDKHTVYVGGTIHILSPEDYPLPSEYDVAYDAADRVVFETDMVAVNSIEFQQKMMAQMVYADGTTLDKVLNADTYAKLKQHMGERNVPIEAMETLKPSLIAVTLSIMELQALGFTSEGVDQFYANKSQADGKPQAWFETPDEQISFLVNLGKDDESGMIDYAIRDIKKLPETINDLRDSWRSGDMQAMADVSIDDFKADYPQIYQDLLVDRNNNWFPKIEAMLNDEPVEFILVGGLHLAGPDSVLAKLAAKGYKIEQL